MNVKIRKNATVKSIHATITTATENAKRLWTEAENTVQNLPFGSSDLGLRRHIAEIRFKHFCELQAFANAIGNAANSK